VNCREAFDPSPEMLMELNLRPEQVKGRKFYHGRGCDTCNNTGHKGRSGLFELFLLNEEIRQMIMEGADKDRLTAAGKRNGMNTLREAGLRAIFEGITTIDEVVRETVLDEDL
jgi:type IV pilus assembly protein PilB